MAEPRKRPTLADVAAAAGVSRATASNAFNRPERLSATSRARILALADELGYAGPDPKAAALRRGRVGAVGIVLADRLSDALADPAALQLLDGIAEAVDTADLDVLLLAGDGNGSGPQPARIAAAAVDGFVCYGLADGDAALAALRRRRLPVVFLDRPPIEGVGAVEVDDESGTAALADHLLGLGHRRLGIVTLPLGLPLARRRLDAALQRLAAGGVEMVSVLRHECHHSTTVEGERAAAWLLGQSPRPTALVCQSDQLALGALAWLDRCGHRVPADVSLAGFDDIAAAATAAPPLTTVRQPLHDRGRRAGGLLLEQLGGAPHQHVVLPSELVVRQSTGRAPSRRHRRAGGTSARPPGGPLTPSRRR